MAFKLPLKRKSDAQPATAPVWHPNFRNFERLPDTKVVRTTFFINLAAAAFASVLLIWVGVREFRIHSLTEQITEANKRIEANTRQNNEALRLSKIFADEEKKLNEAAAFVRTPISPAELLMHLGQTLPKEISIELADLRTAQAPAAGQTIALRGQAAGTPDEASGFASSYVELLRTHPRLAAAFESVELTSINRDARSGFLVFEVVMKIKGEGKGKKP